MLSKNSALQPALDTVAQFGKPVWLSRLASTIAQHLNCAFSSVNLSLSLEEFSIPRQQPLALGGTDLVYAQLLEAWRFFNHRDKVLARWYFEHKWKASAPCAPAGFERETLLAQLIHQGLVEVFEASVNNRVVIAVRPSDPNR